MDATAARDLQVVVNSADFALVTRRVWTSLRQRLAAMDGVDDVAAMTITPIAVTGTQYDFGVMASPDGGYFRTVDRPIVVAGRLPADGAVDEIALNETAVAQLGLGVGDEVKGPTFTPETVAGFLDDTAATDEATGPTLELTVVGVVRTSDELAVHPTTENPGGIVSPAFFDANSGGSGFTMVGYGLRVDRSVVDDDDVLAFVRDDVGERSESVGGVGRGVVRRRGPQRASVAGDRAAGLRCHRRRRRRADGRPGRQPAAHAWRGAPTRRCAGSAWSAGSGRSRSPDRARSPSSPARRADCRRGGNVAVVPDVGRSPSRDRAGLRCRRPRARVRWVGAPRGDARVRGVGGGPIDQSRGSGRLGSLGAGRARRDGRAPGRAGGDRRRHDGRRVRGRPTRRPCPVGRARRVGRRGRRRRRRPCSWPASPPTATRRTGTAGRGTPRPTWSSPDPEAVVARMVDDPDLAAVADVACGPVGVDGVTLYACAFNDWKGATVAPTVAGRLPVGPGEVALGRVTMRQLGVSIGDTVRSDTGDALTVVGETVIPMLDNAEPGHGAIMTDRRTGAAAPMPCGGREPPADLRGRHRCHPLEHAPGGGLRRHVHALLPTRPARAGCSNST